MIVEAAAVSCLLNFSKLPKSRRDRLRERARRLASPFGVRFCQKSECRTWPERLKASAFSSAPIRVKSSLSRASASCSRVVLAPLT